MPAPHESQPPAAGQAPDWGGLLEGESARRVFVGWPDFHGRLRGKLLPVARFLEASLAGVPMSSAALYMDLRGEVEDELWELGRRGWPNVLARPDPCSLSLRSCEPRTAEVMCHLHDAEGRLLPETPRAVLQQVVDRARQFGVEITVGLELEFYLLRADGSLPTRPGHALRAELGWPETLFLRRLWECLEAMALPPEAVCAESGPGQMEVSLPCADPLTACDQATFFRRAVKQLAERAGLTATFMALPLTGASGSGLHLHQTATCAQSGSPLFSQTQPPGERAWGRFVEGQLAYVPELCLLYLPTANSYKRAASRGLGLAQLCWGRDNRTAAVRVIEMGADRVRVENRIAGCDANPYLAVAAALAGGLAGLQEGREPRDPVEVNCARLPPADRGRLPEALPEAIRALADSALARSWFGAPFVEAFTQLKRQEAQRCARAVTDWDRQEYLHNL